MKIFNNKIEKAMQIYKKQENRKEINSTNRLSKTDQLNLSDDAKVFQVAMKAVKDVPDIRRDKVDAVKAEIKSGTYQIDAGKIVEKIFEGISINKKA